MSQATEQMSLDLALSIFQDSQKYQTLDKQK